MKNITFLPFRTAVVTTVLGVVAGGFVVAGVECVVSKYQ